MMFYGTKGGTKLSLVPSPSLVVCREVRGTLHVGKKKGPGIYCLRMENIGPFQDI